VKLGDDDTPPTVGFLEVITLGAACILLGSAAAGTVSLPSGPMRLVFEQPSDEFVVEIELEGMASEVSVLRSSLACTARVQFKSEVLIPVAGLD
jgi:2-methylaconitate cis-trans-isomerase PrpF